jgi:hypothetical protein
VQRFVLRVTLIALALAALLFASRVLGSVGQAEAATAAVDPGTCTQPCWRGVHVTAMTVQESAALLRADPAVRVTSEDSFSVCWETVTGPFENGCAYSWRRIGSRSDRVEILNLFPRAGQFRLGDAVRAFGPPYAYILPCREANGNVYFQGNIIAVMDTSHTRYGPESAISYLSYVTTSAPWYAYGGVDWHGFNGRLAIRNCN